MWIDYAIGYVEGSIITFLILYGVFRLLKWKKKEPDMLE